MKKNNGGKMGPGIFKKLRSEYHRKICENILGLKRDKAKKLDYLNVADSNSKSSVLIADLIVKKMGVALCDSPPVGQTAGSRFGVYTMEFIRDSFSLLHHLRPGKWEFSATGGTTGGISNFDQYKHLLEVKKVLDANPTIKAALGGDYLITPDIIVARYPVGDDEINREKILIETGDDVARYSPLREANSEIPANAILHASISCKWSMRSDRAQNTRTEALNLIRNRKGNTPHIVAVVMEPLPNRIASIAMGSGDVDCTYHAALYELMEAVQEPGLEDQADMLNTLVEGRRLRDISDLPLDLAI